jgi:hypothetical protein
MRTLGRRSLATFLRVALRIVQVALWVLTPLVAFACTIMLLRAYGVQMEWVEMPAPEPVFAWIFTVRSAVALTVAIIIVSRLRSVFATLAAGDQFVPENAAHLRVIWVTLAIGELVRYALDSIRNVSMTALQVTMPEEWEGDLFSVSIGVWFAVLTLIVLAEVFREGARMRQEQQFTI